MKKIIAIIGAMKEEITPILEYFKKYETISLGENTYYKLEYQNSIIIIAYSKIGKIHSALTCSTMILHFNANYVIFSGVAGGLREDLKVGDIILATSLCQYDVDITAFGHKLGFIPESKIYINTNESLNCIAKKVAKKQNINLKYGIIASGDSFVFDNAKKQWIIDNFNASAVEMEGASIAVVSSLCDIPFCIIRSISDSADNNANISFDEFLLESASRSAKFVISMVDEIVKE
ncbi:5'-methylthioadenosine/adenosylhomocysteine nucleosidase [Helicobacter sp. MIT 14-3879]|uniref:5'-methylthioadenosine/adenosylhomocysteine nucleosidase n=1 Tax=Helicobacter sp. MIT 14-3879 TaxID=2040649 RepID=UPI000E1F4CA6|nr:5'-methylthioadenosine/adenosylhomocysteine nucleosidase [Helicobacter sp. MIT 14-3879]RDU63176.1 5'-methylthioadenosine/adenosylhomocysteine nucleosidase [Helicobacter sp. MIT 14-3879]